MTPIKFTAIIPTRQRSDVLEHSLRTVTSQDYQNLEIIVSDNYSGDETENVVRAANDSRIRYINTGKRLSMSDNWEFALSHVSEGWVTILGDDDGLLPGALTKVSRLIEKTKAEAIRSDVCFYSWPSLLGKDYGSLTIPLNSGYEMRKSDEWLAKVMGGEADYGELPMLYTGGFVSTQVLKRIKDKGTPFYRSSIPDVYSAVAIASVTKEYLFIHDLIAINGASKHSTGTSVFAVKNIKIEEPSKKFLEEQKIPFHEELLVATDEAIPSSLQLMVYESYLQTKHLRSPKEEDIRAKQLEIILSKAGKHRVSLRQWAKKFSRRYNLDFETIEHLSQSRSAKQLLQSISSYKFKKQVAQFEGTSARPLRTVSEVAATMAAIQKDRQGTKLAEASSHKWGEFKKFLKHIRFSLITIFFRAFKKAIASFGYDLTRARTGPTDPTLELTNDLRKLLDFFRIDLVLDIGANVGQFGSSLRRSGFAGRILSFEPLSDAYAKLSEQAAPDPTWEVYPRCALGDVDGEIEINIAGNSQSSSVLPMMETHSSAAPDSAYIGKEKTPIWKVDSVALPYLKGSPRTFLKVDTQGFEWQVFDGAAQTLRNVEGVLCELSLTPLYENQRLWVDIVARLESAGFSLWSVHPGFTNPSNRRMLQVDAVFFRSDSLRD